MIRANPIRLDDPITERSAVIAKALSHPARITILKILMERNSCYCGDIADVLPLAQSTVSQHLKALKTAGLISGTVDGVRTCFCLNPDGVFELKRLLTELSDKLVETFC